MIPHILVHTDKINEHSNGTTNAFVIRIRPVKKDDKGLLAHELEGHVKRWWIWTIATSIALTAIAFMAKYFGAPEQIVALPVLSLLSYSIYYKTPWGCLREEVNAYRIQLSLPPATNDPERSLEEYRDMYAGFISNPDPVKGYGLAITKEEAARLLG